MAQTLWSGYLTQGPRVEEFEDALRDYIGNPLVATTNSATSALTLALRLCDVGPGDVVFTTPMTCSATNLPILTAGARPMWIDVDPNTGLVTSDALIKTAKRAISEGVMHHVKAIIVVDWGGLPAISHELFATAWSLLGGLPVIEDAAHAFGSTWNNIRIGFWANYTTFSFQAIKHLTTGDGGALFALDKNKIDQARSLRWYGIDREGKSSDSRIDQDILHAGYKFHMNDLTASLGLAQIEGAKLSVEAHTRNAQILHENLGPIFTTLSPYHNESVSAAWVYTVLLPDYETKVKFKHFMNSQDIQVSEVHRRNDQYTVFKGYDDVDLDGVTQFYDRMVCLPCHSGLSINDLDRIVEVANSFTV